MAFEKIKLVAPVAFVAFIGGIITPSFIEGAKGNEYSVTLEDQMDASVAGDKYDAKTFTSNKLPVADAAGVNFAVDTMLRLAEQDMEEPDPRTKAAASCVLVVANGMELGEAATAAWGDGRNNERSEADGAEKIADQRYLDAAGICLSNLIERATQPDAFVMNVPVSAAA
jgi:hypothetical protein